jgi:hypothetical protein
VIDRLQQPVAKLDTPWESNTPTGYRRILLEGYRALVVD